MNNYLLLLDFDTPPSKNDQQWIMEFIRNGKFYRDSWNDVPDLDTTEIYLEIETSWDSETFDNFLFISTKEHFGDHMESKFNGYHFE